MGTAGCHISGQPGCYPRLFALDISTFFFHFNPAGSDSLPRCHLFSRLRTIRPLLQGAAFACTVMAGLTLNAEASWWWPFESDGMDYAVVTTGVDADTQKWFDTLKLDKKDSDHAPKTMDELGQEGIALESRLRQAMASRGYYDALVDFTLEKNKTPPVLLYKITPNARYRISAVRVDWQGGVVRALDTASFPVHAGDYVDAAAINKHAALLHTEIEKNACLLSLGRDAGARAQQRARHGASHLPHQARPESLLRPCRRHRQPPA